MWNDLLTTALIGTERRTLDLDNLPEAFQDLAAQLEGNAAQHHDAERTLLSLAGALTLHRRIGQAPLISDAPPLELCNLDDLPPCSPRAGLLLQQILALSQHGSQHGSHLQEWITAAAHAGQRVSEEYLPRFLTSLNRAGLPDHFYVVIGKRGRWLAQQNEDWLYAVLPQNDAEWETASFSPRMEYLRRVRAADPAHGRALIESIWRSEKAEVRSIIIPMFEIGLSLADETFLEVALDDRSVAVQRTAASLLASMPASAFSQRMIARAAAFLPISWKRQKSSKKLVIEVKEPQSWDESMGHDGISREAPADFSLTAPYYWLYGVVEKLPSVYWLSGDWSAADLVQAASETDLWRNILLDALAVCVEREKNNDIANALLHTDLEATDQYLVLRNAQPATREAFMLRLLEQAFHKNHDESFNLFARFNNPTFRWSSAFTRRFISSFAQMLPKMSVPDLARLINFLPTCAINMSPDCVEDLFTLANVENKNKQIWSRAVKQAAATLEFRRNIHKEFAR